MSQYIGSAPKIKARQKKNKNKKNTVEEIKLTFTVKDMSHVQTRSGQQPFKKKKKKNRKKERERKTVANWQNPKQ